MFIYLYFFEGDPPAAFIIPFHTEKLTYKQSEAITIKAHICKTNVFPATVNAVMVALNPGEGYPTITGKTTALPTVYTTGVGRGCGDYAITGFFRVPSDIDPGRYYMKATVNYRVNFLRERLLDWYTTPFTVIN